jgi:hypothetical protein
MNRNQHTPCGNVQCSGELKEVLAVLVVTPDKYGYCEGQTNPFTALHFRLAMVQNPTLPVTLSLLCYRTLGAKQRVGPSKPPTSAGAVPVLSE